MSTELENQNQTPQADPAPEPNRFMKMLDDALADPNTPEETKQEIRDSQAKLAAKKDGDAYSSANRYAHNAITVNRSTTK